MQRETTFLTSECRRPNSLKRQWLWNEADECSMCLIWNSAIALLAGCSLLDIVICDVGIVPKVSLIFSERPVYEQGDHRIPRSQKAARKVIADHWAATHSGGPVQLIDGFLLPDGSVIGPRSAKAFIRGMLHATSP